MKNDSHLATPPPGGRFEGAQRALPFQGNRMVAGYLQRVGTLFVIAAVSSLSFGKDFREYLNFAFIAVLYGMVAVTVGPVVFHGDYLRRIALRVLGVEEFEIGADSYRTDSFDERAGRESARKAGETRKEEVSEDTLMLLADGVGEEFRELFSPEFLREEADLNSMWHRELERRRAVEEREKLASFEPSFFMREGGGFVDSSANSSMMPLPAVSPSDWPTIHDSVPKVKRG